MTAENIIPLYVTPEGVKTKRQLKNAFEMLMNYVSVHHTLEDSEQKDDPLQVLVRYSADKQWIEISPLNIGSITRFTFGDFPMSDEVVPVGFVSVFDVDDAKCIEVEIDSTRYRFFSEPGMRAPRVEDSEIPAAYHITYCVKGDVWRRWLDIDIGSPSEQIEQLDAAFEKLKEHVDLYFPVHRANYLYPDIRLAFNTIENGTTYINVDYLPSCGHGMCDSDHCKARLENIIFKHSPDKEISRRVLGIHGGAKTVLKIENIEYEIQMAPGSCSGSCSE